MAQWTIELSEFGIQYKLCLAIKRQILVDFLAELPQQEADMGNTNWWILIVDGAFPQTGASVGLYLKALTEERIEHAIRLDFPMSNNEAKYESMLAGIDLTNSVSFEKIIIQSYSQLVVG